LVTLNLKNLKIILRKKNAEHAFKILCSDDWKDSIYKKDLVISILKILKNREVLSRILRDTSNIGLSVNRLLDVLIVVVFIISLIFSIGAVFNLDAISIFALVSPVITSTLAFSFVFSQIISDSFTSISFLFFFLPL